GSPAKIANISNRWQIPYREMRARSITLPQRCTTGSSRNDKRSLATKASFFTFEILGFRLDSETDSRLSFSGNLGLILQVSAAFVKRRNDCEQNCRSQHDPDEKHEVAGAL